MEVSVFVDQIWGASDEQIWKFSKLGQWLTRPKPLEISSIRKQKSDEIDEERRWRFEVQFWEISPFLVIWSPISHDMGSVIHTCIWNYKKINRKSCQNEDVELNLKSVWTVAHSAVNDIENIQSNLFSRMIFSFFFVVLQPPRDCQWIMWLNCSKKEKRNSEIPCRRLLLLLDVAICNDYRSFVFIIIENQQRTEKKNLRFMNFISLHNNRAQRETRNSISIVGWRKRKEFSNFQQHNISFSQPVELQSAVSACAYGVFGIVSNRFSNCWGRWETTRNVGFE